MTVLETYFCWYLEELQYLGGDDIALGPYFGIQKTVSSEPSSDDDFDFQNNFHNIRKLIEKWRGTST